MKKYAYLLVFWSLLARSEGNPDVPIFSKLQPTDRIQVCAKKLADTGDTSRGVFYLHADTKNKFVPLQNISTVVLLGVMRSGDRVRALLRPVEKSKVKQTAGTPIVVNGKSILAIAMTVVEFKRLFSHSKSLGTVEVLTESGAGDPILILKDFNASRAAPYFQSVLD